jgi:hypothetical protein
MNFSTPIHLIRSLILSGIPGISPWNMDSKRIPRSLLREVASERQPIDIFIEMGIALIKELQAMFEKL